MAKLCQINRVKDSFDRDSLRLIINALVTKTVAIDTLGGNRNLKMKIKAQQMTFRQDITKNIIYNVSLYCSQHLQSN
jgi:hypothetical protein